MKKKKKMNLKTIEIQSFIVLVERNEHATIKGGAESDLFCGVEDEPGGGAIVTRKTRIPFSGMGTESIDGFAR